MILDDMKRLNKQINSSDVNIRIKGKKEAKELGFAVVPINGKDEVMPTKKLIQRLYDMNEFDAIETLEQRG